MSFINERTSLLPKPLDEKCIQHVIYLPKMMDEYDEILDMDMEASSLSMEELMPYIDDPKWIYSRRIIGFIIWLTFCVTLIIACGLSLNGCRSENSIIIKSSVNNLVINSAP